MTSVELREVCSQCREQVRPGDRSDLRYIGLESIESDTGEFVVGALSKTPEDPRAVSFRFDARHVLYGKLRPYLNKVATPNFEGKCSTELVPLLPSNILDRHYLAYFLRSRRTVDSIVARVSGARMPRADMDHLLGLQIPLRPLPDQHRIVDLLSRAEGIVRLRREAACKAAEITPALFLSLFGDPIGNPKGWPLVALGDVLTACDYGTSKKASPVGEGTPVLRMGNVTYAGDLNLADLKHVVLGATELRRQSLKPGDLLFNRTNSKELVGKTGLWDGRWPAVAASYFIRLRADTSRITPMYIWAFMNSRDVKRRLFEIARGAIGQANINSQELRAIPIPLPPLAIQNQLGTYADIERSIVNQQNVALAKAQAAFDALLHQSFASA